MHTGVPCLFFKLYFRAERRLGVHRLSVDLRDVFMWISTIVL